MLVTANVAATESQHYRISVSGPFVNIETSCNDPCQFDKLEVIGESGGQPSGDDAKTASSEEPGEDEQPCEGDCVVLRQGKEFEQRGLRIKFDPKRDLKQGLEVTINDGNAHFIFYKVVDTEQGQATRRQYAEFRIDRPLIEAEIHGHDVSVRTGKPE